MSTHDKRMVGWSTGPGQNFAKVENHNGSWEQFIGMVNTAVRTNEPRHKFDKMSKDEQDRLKSVDGWICGARFANGVRNLNNILPRDLVSLDLDYVTVELAKRLAEGDTAISNLEFFCHSSRRHTPEDPRLRIFLPLSRTVDRDEYSALVRLLSSELEEGVHPLVQVDKVSARPAQMMFKPTVCKDGEFVAYRNEGDILDVDALFERYPEWRDIGTLPLFKDEEHLRERVDKAEDPTTKRGPVGDFCRAYGVEEAMAKFLPDTYIVSDENSAKPRYTYADSTSSNGAIVEDDGLFLYSHHGSDPVCDMLVNAFDLVRIHLFGKKDEKAQPNTTMAQMPSFKAMIDYISEDEEYKASRIQSKFDTSEMFEDFEDDEDDEPPVQSKLSDQAKANIAALLGDDVPEAEEPEEFDTFEQFKMSRKRPKPKKGWFQDTLDFNSKTAEIKATPSNVLKILENDAGFGSCVVWDEFNRRKILYHDIRTRGALPDHRVQDKVHGDPWQDAYGNTLKMAIDDPGIDGEKGRVGYGLTTGQNIIDSAIQTIAEKNRVNPVKEYLEWCDARYDPANEGNLETVLIRYLGVDDNVYTREAAKLFMVAAVTRIYEPGHKFDYAWIFSGKQGKGKSGFLAALFSEKWYGDLPHDLSDTGRVVETMLGKWCLEMAELSSLNKSDSEDAKAFMRRQNDARRMAYGKEVMDLPRMSVVAGTVNRDTYLKDVSGNRSYWTMKTHTQHIDLDGVRAERDQLWAEAYREYRRMRSEKPVGTLFLSLSPASLKIAEALQEEARARAIHEEWADSVRDIIDTPIRYGTLMSSYGLSEGSFDDLDGEGIDPDTLVLRTVWRPSDMISAVLGIENGIIKNYTQQAEWTKALENLGDEYATKVGSPTAKRHGIVARWRGVGKFTIEEQLDGYVVFEDDFKHDLL